MDIKRDISSKAMVETGEAYRDLEGNIKHFTHIDHDPKIRVSYSKDNGDKWDPEEYRNELIERILEHSAVFCPEPFFQFTKRGENVVTITWREDMLRDHGCMTENLRDLAVMLENRK